MQLLGVECYSFQTSLTACTGDPMSQEDRSETLRWRELAAHAATEQDSDKLMQIVKELCEEIAQDKQKKNEQADGTAA